MVPLFPVIDHGLSLRVCSSCPLLQTVLHSRRLSLLIPWWWFVWRFKLLRSRYRQSASSLALCAPLLTRSPRSWCYQWRVVSSCLRHSRLRTCCFAICGKLIKMDIGRIHLTPAVPGSLHSIDQRIPYPFVSAVEIKRSALLENHLDLHERMLGRDSSSRHGFQDTRPDIRSKKRRRDVSILKIQNGCRK